MADGINYNLLTAEIPTFGRAYEAARQREMQSKMQAQQYELSTMQLEQAKKEQAALAEMQRKFVENGKSPDLAVNFRAMMDSGIPHYVDIGMKGLQSLENQRRFRDLIGGGAAAPAPAAASISAAAPAVAPAPLVETAPNGVPVTLTSVPVDTGIKIKPLVQSQPTNALAPAAAAAPEADANALALERKIAAAYELGTPAALAWAQAREKELAEMRKPQIASPGSSVLMGGKVITTVPGKEEALPAIVRQYNFAKTPEGGGFKGSLLDYERSVAAAARQPAAAAPVTPVTIIDPKDPSKTIVVDGRTGKLIGQGPKEPSVGVELSAKEKQAREAKYPQATAAVKTFETKSDSLTADLEKLANHPGLSGISGVLYGRTPGLTKEARAAQALYDSIIARGGFAELQAMRAASPTGGALGNVSNQEGQYLRDAFAALNRTQDTADLASALRAAAASVRGAKQRTREAYDLTYEYKTGGGKSESAPDPLGIR